MDRYVYKPLPAENLCVRLLRLLPGPRDAEIQCEMMNYSIDQSRSYGLYEALSYVWGDPSNKIRVAVRDQDDAHFRYLEVTTNLYAGLLRLRDTRTSRLIWIDAISINQHDLVERGQQVQRMATIYANSSQVVVWLGPGSSDGENPHHCREAFTRIRQSTTHTNVLPDDVRTLLKREWFTRVWVTQEVAAARALSILYGNEEMSGVNFARGLQNFSQAFTSEDKAFATYVPALLDLMVWSPTVSTIHHPLPTLNFAPLEEIVEMFHTKEATDQRDKIYALLGLRSDNGSTRVPIPNYLKPWAHVFREFIQFVLGSEAQVLTHEQQHHAVVSTTGCALGVIGYVDHNKINVFSNKSYVPIKDRFRITGWNAEIAIRKYCKQIKGGDLICVIKGARYPTVIRANEEHFEIIVIALTSKWTIQFNDTSIIGPWNHRNSQGELPAQRLVNQWLSKRSTSSMHKFLLVWTWETVHTNVPNEATTIGDLRRLDSVGKATGLNELDLSSIRKLNVRRILNDANASDYQTLAESQTQMLTSLQNPEISKSQSRVQFELITSHESQEALVWLEQHARTVNNCIYTIKRKMWKDKNVASNLENFIEKRVYRNKFDYGPMGLVGFEEFVTTELWCTPETSILHDIGRHCSCHKKYWEFGELAHNDFLQVLFPAYRKAALALRSLPGHSSGQHLPFNGRYLMKLLLAPESFEEAAIGNPVSETMEMREHDTPKLRRFNDASEVLRFATMREIFRMSEPELPASDKRIVYRQLGYHRASFLLAELWDDKTTVCAILKEAFDPQPPAGEFFTYLNGRHDVFKGTVLMYHTKTLLEHLQTLDPDNLAALHSDPIFKVLLAHRPALIGQTRWWTRLNETFRMFTMAKAVGDLEHVSAWIAMDNEAFSRRNENPRTIKH